MERSSMRFTIKVIDLVPAIPKMIMLIIDEKIIVTDEKVLVE